MGVDQCRASVGEFGEQRVRRREVTGSERAAVDTHTQIPHSFPEPGEVSPEPVPDTRWRLPANTTAPCVVTVIDGPECDPVDGRGRRHRSARRRREILPVVCTTAPKRRVGSPRGTGR
jgi:hypothetical protein